MKPILTIQMVGYNSARDLPTALKVLAGIPAEQVVIRYIDNNSEDNSIDLVKTALPAADIIRNTKNIGFGPAHNLGFASCTTDLIMVHNPDLQLHWPGVARLLELFTDEKLGAVQGKLLRRKAEAGKEELDSTGITLTLGLNGHERGAGKIDTGQYDEDANITAVTGAAGIYRYQALLDVAHTSRAGVPEIFDHDFFAYKEDVDLGWRLNRRGWEVRYAPILHGYHQRSLKREGYSGWGNNPRRIYQRLVDQRTSLSFRNWVWMITKNATVMQLVLHAPFVLLRMLAFMAAGFIYPRFWLTWKEVIVGIPAMLRKRG